MLSKTHSKYIQSLHHKKYRDAAQAFIAEGNKTVPELVAGGHFVCKEILATTGWLQENSVFLQKNFHGVVHELQPHEMEKISALSTASEVLGVFEMNPPGDIEVKNRVSLLLDTIQDPGNLGTIIRIADWFGIGNVICSEATADMYNPKVVQSTMGSLGRVKVYYIDLVQWMEANKHIRSYAAALDGSPVQQLKGLQEGLIIIGNESRGISENILSLSDEKITIHKIGAAESLNAAVATGIILSHLA